MLRVHLRVAGVLDLTVVVGKSGAAMQVIEDDQARKRESQAREEYERRRCLAAARLVDRFRRSGGFDYAALGEASARWLQE
jgi:hypothetical protein